MRVFEDQEFPSWRERGGNVFEDMVFRRCEFVSSALSITEDPAQRSTVRNVRLERCKVAGCSLYCAVVEDVVVDGLQTSDLHQSWGAVFKHVVLRGKIGRLMITPYIDSRNIGSELQRSLDRANAAYYEGVDWALDISAAETIDLSIRGLPARLIRRDPDTQAVVTRKAALSGEWRQLERLMDSEFRYAIEFMLEDGDEDVVLIADKRSKRFDKLIAAIEEARAAGIAEPD